ncbi:MAG: polysaccharide pyruvyl transferase family protein [Desulfobacteraceae bacterium]
MKPIKLYWSTKLKNGRKNFGDWLSVVLIREIFGRDVIYAKPNRCDLIAIGSILQKLKHKFWNRRVHVWGSGFIGPHPPVPAHHFYHAVRGEMSGDLIGGSKIENYGDPGLLADRLLPNHASMSKYCRIGVVPHYKDRDNAEVAEFADRIPDARVLDVLTEPEDFLKAAAGCEFILSSSLHGLVIADSFEIPNAWIELSDAVRGSRFKFKDYYSAFGIADPEPVNLKDLRLSDIDRLTLQYMRPRLREIQQGLLASFPFTA